MQYCCAAADNQLDLQGEIADFEKQVEQLVKEKADKDSAFAVKELQLLHFKACTSVTRLSLYATKRSWFVPKNR